MRKAMDGALNGQLEWRLPMYSHPSAFSRSVKNRTALIELFAVTLNTCESSAGSSSYRKIASRKAYRIAVVVRVERAHCSRRTFVFNQHET